MNLPNEKVSEALAAVMGICWHDGRMVEGRDYTDVLYNCVYCGDFYEYPFSAFTPDGIWQWKSYMEREMKEGWIEYLKKQRTGWSTTTLDNQLNPHNLVNWLKNNLDKWGYVKCVCGGDGKVFDYDTLLEETCLFCTGSGKVLTERAKKFKAIVEGEHNEKNA